MSITGIHNAAHASTPLSSGTTAGGPSSGGPSSGGEEEGVQAFLDYARETPAQRLFDNWLSTQHMSMEQFNSLSAGEKAKLLEQYRQQLERQMGATNQDGMGAVNGTFISTTA